MCAQCLMGSDASVDCCFARDDGPRGDGADGVTVAVEEAEAGDENLGEDRELRDEGRTTPPPAAAAGGEPTTAAERSSARDEGPRGRSSRLIMAASSASSCSRKEWGAELRAE